MKSPLLLALVAVFACSRVATAESLNFNFSFTGTIGTATGLVTGEIFGLQNNATSLPTDVILTSAPSGFGSAFGSDYDFGAPASQTGYTGITVTNGTVTGGGFELLSPDAGSSPLASIAVSESSGNELGYGSAYTESDLAANISEAPEPSIVALMLGGLGILVSVQLRTLRA